MVRYPTISQYIDALQQPGAFVRTIGDFTLCRRRDSEPIYRSGNFGAVFKALIGVEPKVGSDDHFAIKCFTRNQWGRREAYTRISKSLPRSEYLISVNYLPDELLVAPYGSDALLRYDALLMDYVEGATLTDSVVDAASVGDSTLLGVLCRKFVKMALWLLDEPFAHGDIKPENIVVDGDLNFKLVDYDGVFTPDMEGEAQREFGTEAYQHPLRCSMPFSKSIDDYSIAIIALSLYVIAKEPNILRRFKSGYETFLINPREAICNSSPALHYISSCALAPELLVSLVSSPVASLVELRYALLELSDILDRESMSSILGVGLDELLVVEIGGRWGYVDGSGVVAIAPIYDMAWEFADDGIALVKMSGRYGFIDRTSNFIVPAILEYATSFSEGVAVAALDGKYGYMNSSGGWVVEPQYDFARSVRGGFGEVELGGATLIIKVEVE